MSEYRKIGDAAFQRPGLTTYIENGVLKEAAANIPVFEGGMFRCFDSVTNHIARGNDSPADYGRVEGGSLTVPSHPDGPVNYFEFTENEINSEHFVQHTSSDGGLITFSAFVKSGTTSRTIRVRHQDAYTADFDIVNGSLISMSQQVIDAGLVDLDYGYILYMTVDNAGSGPNVFRLQSVSGSSGSYPGDGTSSFIFGGMQVSDGAFLKPYIPTSGSVTTCPKSDCSFPSTAALSGDSWEWSCTVKKHQEASDRYIMSCGNISLYVNDTNVTFAIGSDEVTVNGLLPDNAGTEITIQKTPAQIMLNGNSIPLTQAPAPGATVQIGSDVNLLNQLNGYVKGIEVKKL